LHCRCGGRYRFDWVCRAFSILWADIVLQWLERFGHCAPSFPTAQGFALDGHCKDVGWRNIAISLDWVCRAFSILWADIVLQWLERFGHRAPSFPTAQGLR
jgi:uncharacterized protein YsxB (DUF464 family)